MASTISAGTTSGTAIAVAGDTSGVLQLQTNGTTAAVSISTGQQVQVHTAGTASAPVISKSDDTNTGIFFPAADTIAFSEGGAESMRIDSSGNVLVGTTSTSIISGWSVKGIAMSGDLTGGAMTINSSSSTGTQYFIGFGRGGSLCGSIQSTGTNATSYSTSSDYRLKENIAPMTGALDKVAQLKPVTYTWKSDGTESQGFIAHELQAVVPDCVIGEKDAVDEDGNIKPQGVDTSFLVATLTAAIQELKAIVDTQAIEIAALKGTE
jgi:hypothetical protein